MAEPITYESTLPMEVTPFTWTIKDFSTITDPLLGQLNLSPSIEFEAGQSLGITSKWRLQFTYCETLFYLQLYRVDHTESKTISVSCVAEIKKRDHQSNLYAVTFGTGTKTCCANLRDLTNYALIDDKLTIHLKFTLALDNFSTFGGQNDSCGVKWMEQFRKGLSMDFGSLLETGLNSDFIIQAKNSNGILTEIKVHKIIESEMKEREKGTMLITDLSSECVEILLKWMYTGDLDDRWSTIPVEMVNAADKYELPLLLKFLPVSPTIKTLSNLEKLRNYIVCPLPQRKFRNLLQLTLTNCWTINKVEVLKEPFPFLNFKE